MGQLVGREVKVGANSEICQLSARSYGANAMASQLIRVRAYQGLETRRSSSNRPDMQSYVIKREHSTTIPSMSKPTKQSFEIGTIRGEKTLLNEPRSLAVQDDHVYVVNSDNRILIFDRGARGNVSPIHIIGGSKSLLDYPIGIATRNGQVFVTNRGVKSELPSINIYDKANRSASTAPLDRICGPRTELCYPSDVAFSGDQLVVSNFCEQNPKISWFELHGVANRSPIKRITGPRTLLDQPRSLAITGTSLYVANRKCSRILKFSTTDEGDRVPAVVLESVDTFDRPTGLLVRCWRGRAHLLVSSFGNSWIACIRLSLTPPSPRNIAYYTSHHLKGPRGMSHGANGEVFVVGGLSNSVAIFKPNYD